MPIGGDTVSVRKALREEQEACSATSFPYDEDPLYSSGESRLIRHYLAEHGSMPGADGSDDLF